MIHKPFNSFLMGGFECSTHKDSRGRRLDLIESTRHDEFAEADYERLMNLGIRTCRDGLRWHLIEPEPYRYDFSSVRRQADAAKKTGIQVIWDYFHYGFPDDLDIFSPAFVERFRSFCIAATDFLVSEFGGPPAVCPVNEISFFSWIAGTAGQFFPCARKRGHELKVQLVRAAIEASAAIREACPEVTLLFTDPAIHVVSNSVSQAARRAAEKYRMAQFEAFDMLVGRRSPDLGGRPEHVDVIGLNYYFHNQWFHHNRRKIPPGHRLYRPLSEILREFYLRYDKPLLIAETGIEDDERPTWFRYISEQTQAARAASIPVDGVCLYPIVNHPGWADDRHCHNGLWDYADETGHREIFEPLSLEIEAHSQYLQNLAANDFK